MINGKLQITYNNQAVNIPLHTFTEISFDDRQIKIIPNSKMILICKNNIVDEQLNLDSSYLVNYVYIYCGKIKICKLDFQLNESQPMKKDLTFKTFQEANVARLPLFKNSKGGLAHSKSDGSDWSDAQWLQALIGELGEYANVKKKIERGDLTEEEGRPLLGKEIADVWTYLSILTYRLGFDPDQIITDKFNEVSDRVKCGVKIEKGEVVYDKDYLKIELNNIKNRQKQIESEKKEKEIKIGNFKFHEELEAKEKKNDFYKIDSLLNNPDFMNKMNVDFYDRVATSNVSIIGFAPRKNIIKLQNLGDGSIIEYSSSIEYINSKKLLCFMNDELLLKNDEFVKILVKGNSINTDYTNFGKNDLIQFSDSRNVLYSYRVIECESKLKIYLG